MLSGYLLNVRSSEIASCCRVHETDAASVRYTRSLVARRSFMRAGSAALMWVVEARAECLRRFKIRSSKSGWLVRNCSIGRLAFLMLQSGRFRLPPPLRAATLPLA